MMSNFELLLIILVVWLLVTEAVSESYTLNIGGYVFTSPGLSIYRKKDEAITWCTSNGSTLLEIKSSYIQNLTALFLSGTGVQFEGITLLFTNGIRTDGNWNWVNGLGINSITVAGQGQDLSISYGYINFIPSTRGIVATTPTEMRGYICQGTFACANGFLLNGFCYKSYNSPTMSWFDARNKCLNDGGELASFDFINDDNGLNSALNGSWLNSSATYWIGIRKQWWKWKTSNLEALYTNWMNGRPLYIVGSECLCLQQSGGEWNWIECNCNSPYPFVCLKELPATPSTSTSSAHVTPTNPTERTIPSSRSGNISATYSNPSTMKPQLSTAMALISTESTGQTLGIALGVGIGGALIIAAIIVAICLVVRKHGRPSCLRKSPASNPPDVILHPVESHYADIPKQPGYDNSSTMDGNQFSTPTVYSQLEILTGSSSPTHDKDSISLLSSKTATLAPPVTHKGITHFTVDGEQYAEVMK